MQVLKLSIIAALLLFFYNGCTLINNNCSFDEFVIPVDIHPMKDTFHVGDTMRVHIEFPEIYQYNNDSYTISSESIDFIQFVGFIQDTNFLVETALKNSEVITDTSQFNVFKYQFQVNGAYSILGDIDKMDEKFILDYAFTLRDTGVVISSFTIFPYRTTEPKVEFEDCSSYKESFKLQLPPNKDDNYQIYLEELKNRDAFSPGSSEEYKSAANYTFYVVE